MPNRHTLAAQTQLRAVFRISQKMVAVFSRMASYMDLMSSLPTAHQQLKIRRTGLCSRGFRTVGYSCSLPVLPLAQRYTAWGVSVCRCVIKIAILSVSWSGYRTRRTMAWFMPLVIIVIALASAVSGVYNGPWLFVFSIVAYAVLFFWFQSWRCPGSTRAFLARYGAAKSGVGFQRSTAGQSGTFRSTALVTTRAFRVIPMWSRTQLWNYGISR
jgi:hypothetical protein